jgi:spore coat polysaccharide biosynthesis protein SpsF
MPRVIASIEARMGSSRFPGKVLADICGRSALDRLYTRLQQCKTLDGIILATTTAPGDDVLEQWAAAAGVPCHRGSEDDVLLRVVEAQRRMESEIVVEVCGDCVMLDPELIDLGVETFFGNDCDLVTNVRVPSYPIGEVVQVFRLCDLEEVERAISDPLVREHVSLYFYQRPDRYRILNLYAPARWRAPEYRFHLDYPEDRDFLIEIHRRLAPEYGDRFGIEEIMAVLRREPELVEINGHMKERIVR